MAKAKARKGGAARRSTRAAKTTRTGGRKSARKPTRKTAARKAASRTTTSRSRKAGRRKAVGRKTAVKKTARAAVKATKITTTRRGKTTGPGRARSVKPHGPRGSSGRGINPMPIKHSTGIGSGAGVSRSPYLERERRRLPEVEEGVPTPPSSLDLDRRASAVRTGRDELSEALQEHTDTSPALTGGDVDADWQNAASSGEEAPGGDNPTPDQQRVDDIGKALGVEYQDNEELRGVDKLDQRDKHRWELDPASSEDYRDRRK